MDSQVSRWDSIRDASHDDEVVNVSQPESGIFVLQLNTPENHNIMTPTMMGAFARKMDFLSAMEPEQARCIIITAAGSSFCAGVDINAIRDEPHFESYWTREVDPFLAIQECRVPVISCVQGAALTGGFEIAVSADIVLASKDAIFRDNHAMYGILHIRGLSQILPRICGPSNAKLATLASFPIAADKALAWHLISNVVQRPEDLLPAATQIASAILYNSGPAQFALKRAMNRGLEISYGEARDLELRTEEEYFESVGDARPDILSKGSARFNERVAEIDSPEGMKGGILSNNHGNHLQLEFAHRSRGSSMALFPWKSRDIVLGLAALIPPTFVWLYYSKR